MNTNQRSIALQSGEALAVDRQGGATLFLVQGEVLLQGAAEWLGGTVVLPPARRVVAPAALPDGSHSIMAIGAARLQVVVPASAMEKLLSAWQGLQWAGQRFLRLSRP